MNFHEVISITKKDAEKIFIRCDNPELICDALLRLTYHDPDLMWVQDKCIEFLKYPNKMVKEMAVTCLGHLARIHGQIGNPKLVSILNELLEDPEISGKIEDTLDDIKIFLKPSNFQH